MAVDRTSARSGARGSGAPFHLPASLPANPPFTLTGVGDSGCPSALLTNVRCGRVATLMKTRRAGDPDWPAARCKSLKTLTLNDERLGDALVLLAGPVILVHCPGHRINDFNSDSIPARWRGQSHRTTETVGRAVPASQQQTSPAGAAHESGRGLVGERPAWAREGAGSIPAAPSERNIMSEILNDKRRITEIFFDDAAESCFTVATGHEIEAYAEPGIYGSIPYFRVIKDGKVVARVPAWHVMVRYSND